MPSLILILFSINHLNLSWRLNQIQCQYFHNLCIHTFLCKEVPFYDNGIYPFGSLSYSQLKSLPSSLEQVDLVSLLAQIFPWSHPISNHIYLDQVIQVMVNVKICNAMQWNEGASTYLNALWVGGNLFDSLRCIESRCHLKAPRIVANFSLCFM